MKLKHNRLQLLELSNKLFINIKQRTMSLLSKLSQSILGLGGKTPSGYDVTASKLEKSLNKTGLDPYNPNPEKYSDNKPE